MTHFDAWLWRRHREHYVVIIFVLCTALLELGLVLPGVAFASLFAEVSFDQAVLWNVLACALTIIASVIGCWFSRATLRPLTAWAQGDESDAEASWNAALSIPATIARSVAKTEWVAHSFVSVPYIALIAHLSIFDAIVLGLGSAMLVVVGGIAFGNGLHVLLRPCLDEIAPHLPLETRPLLRGWNLAGRLNLGVASMSFIAPIGVTAAVLGDRATMRDYVVALGASAVMTGYVVAVFDLGLVRPIVRTVRDLLAGIDRVHRGEFDERVPITSIDEFGDLTAAFNELQRAMRERAALQAAFGSYVDPTLAQRLLTQGNSVFEGEDVDVSVFFVDVRGFTTIVEAVSAPVAVTVLNSLFEILVPVIQSMGGHANHYTGDGLLAVFGTPNAIEDHADRAVAAAIEIQRRVTRQFGADLRIGIGINTGRVTAGTIGGGGRYEFTVIGDTVNVASRVEQMTKTTGDAILLTQATLDAMTATLCHTINRGDIELRGKSRDVCVYACLPIGEVSATLS